MAVFKYEVKKLFSSISIWGLLLFFLIFNLFLVWGTQWNGYPEFVSEVAETTGVVLGDDFSERIDELSVSPEEREMLDFLKEDTIEAVDHFDDYDITEVGETYIRYLNQVYSNQLSDTLSNNIRNKYSDMQKVVNQKGEADEALSLGHASATNTMHENLFDTILGWLMVEGMILVVLIAILSAGFEKGNETEGIVFTTQTGRNVQINKLAASLVLGLGSYLLLTFATLLVYFIVHDYSTLWQSYVSNIFNYRNDIIAGYRPFVTWQSHTVLSYLLSKIGITLGLLISFVLSAFIVEMTIRNSYISFFVILIINGLFVVLPMAISLRTFGFYLMLSPAWLVLKHSIWFTDGDVDILWRNFEMVGTTFSLLLLTLGAWAAYYRFKRRDLS